MVRNNGKKPITKYQLDEAVANLLDGFGTYAFRSSGLAELTGSNFTGIVKIVGRALDKNISFEDYLFYQHNHANQNLVLHTTYDAIQFTKSGSLLVNTSVEDLVNKLIVNGSALFNNAKIIGGDSTTSTLILGVNDNATISSPYSMVFQVDNNNTIPNRVFTWKKGGKGYLDGTTIASLSETSFTAPSFVKSGGTSDQILCANGSVAELGKQRAVYATGIFDTDFTVNFNWDTFILDDVTNRSVTLPLIGSSHVGRIFTIITCQYQLTLNATSPNMFRGAITNTSSCVVMADKKVTILCVNSAWHVLSISPRNF